MAMHSTQETSLGQRWVRRCPVFYGWVILFSGTLGLIMTSPGQTYAISMFIDHFIDDLGLSRTLVSGLYTAATLTSSLALPRMGRWIDQKGSRYAVVTIALCFSCVLFAMRFVEGAVTLLLGFVLLRFLGQGSLSIVSSNVINQWWVKRRGTVMGIAGMSAALLGTGTFPPLIDRCLAAYGWRPTYTILGCLLLLVMAPLGYLLFRDRPELYGLQPDGGELPAEADPSAEPNAWTLEQARASSTFWVVSAGLATIAMLITGLHFHAVSIFLDAGLKRSVAADIFFPIAATTAVITLVSGLLKDRFEVKYLLTAALLLQAAALALASNLGNWSPIYYGLSLGATAGLFRTVSGVVWADLFGRKHLGAISGLATTLMVAGSALGPLPLGYARDASSGYQQALLWLTILPVLLAFLTLFLKKPQLAEED